MSSEQAAGQGKRNIIRALAGALVISRGNHKADGAAMLTATDFGKAGYGSIHADLEQLEWLVFVEGDLEKSRFSDFFSGSATVADKIKNQVEGGANISKWTAPVLKIF